MLDMSVYTCYMCTWFLNKCHKLMTQALKAQDIMKQYLETKEVPTSLQREFYNLSAVNTMDVDLNLKEIEIEPFIKEEIKEEIVDVELELDGITPAVKQEQEEKEELNECNEFSSADENHDTKNTNQIWIHSEKTFSEATSNSCSICGRIFHRANDLKKHYRTHTGEKPYSCGICGKSFSQIGSLNTHTRIHTEKKPYSCNVCGKQFNRRSNMTTHSEIHSGERPHSCNMCGRTFNHSSNLRRHIKTHLGEKRPQPGSTTANGDKRETSFSCIVCGKSFNLKSNLNRHIKTHTREKRSRSRKNIKNNEKAVPVDSQMTLTGGNGDIGRCQ
ncbi:zinc finger protein 436-like isoform X2 [Leptidea sinapis]|nr:zinc finger protein 436-like isoform X2 [Leptidea sinapis]